ncbi:alpha/beta hydrolase [Streptomyces sp. NBC_01340]|uniref:alpha/beta hydrolase n=1 Tax=unclassified Streptomyces TaxID=2593676 RepID=UPI00224D0B3A|nr:MULTISPECIES: alpha/beta hydrolase [unclassified Streptomyces]MCX4459300.1 alpha/beta hydrolase [Streptomyces sp. NBC_01719]MCX4498657.1 alpha/beta hydrolase [Streptomyces sp. NBC_01728]WSI43135.1 alpha/beta hydrolase [Streptomyces sp. NBC_01340]
MLSAHQRWAYAGAGVVTLAMLAASLPSAVATAAEGPDLSRFYHQQVKWGACKGEGMPADLQCGQVTVPLDYAHPEAGTLDLALARYRATGASRGSVLLNFGGPGVPGVPQLASTSGKDFMPLTNGYDVVTFDPRGVGRSSPVSCGSGAAQASGTTGPATGDSSPEALLKQVRKDADECAKHSSPLLAHIGTVNASRDLDVMRQALGDKKLNYLGFSYGTRLGAVYASQFPDKTGRIVLDGVDTLTEPLSEAGIVSAEGQQTALEDFLTWCTKDEGCPFGRDPRDARQQVARLVASLDKNPVPTNFGQTFSGQDLVATMGLELFDLQRWPTLERSLTSLVQDGDPSGLLQAAGGVALPHSTYSGLVDPANVPPDNLETALVAINCADDPDRPSAEQLTKEIDELKAAYQEASPIFGPLRLNQLLMCYGRPKGTDYIREKVRDVHTPKMLLVGTRGDPATPYRWTKETAERLGPSAVVLDNRGEGHTGYASSKCVREKVTDFLLYGSLPDNGSSCGPEDSTAP